MTMNFEELKLLDIPDKSDPLILLRRHREEIAQKYPTIDALCEYYRQFDSVEDALARVREKIADKNREEHESPAM